MAPESDVSPLRGFTLRLNSFPWARAHGYVFSSLRG
jgi:hypothetical protein